MRKYPIVLRNDVGFNSMNFSFFTNKAFISDVLRYLAVPFFDGWRSFPYNPKVINFKSFPKSVELAIHLENISLV